MPRTVDQKKILHTRETSMKRRHTRSPHKEHAVDIFSQLQAMFPQYDETEIKKVVRLTNGSIENAAEMILANANNLQFHKSDESRQHADYAVASLEQEISSAAVITERTRVHARCEENAQSRTASSNSRWDTRVFDKLCELTTRLSSRVSTHAVEPLLTERE